MLSENNRTRRKLIVDRNQWNKLWCCIETIEISQEAINSYPIYATFSSEHNLSAYILIYGIMNTLTLQQESINKILNIFDVCPNIPPETKEQTKKIKILRNHIAAHPISKNKKREETYSIHPNHSAWVFKIDEYGTEDAESEDINVRMKKIFGNLVYIDKLIKFQYDWANFCLTEIINTYEKKEEDHRMKFKNNKLESIFKGADYISCKIKEGIISNSSPHFDTGEAHTKILMSMMENFRDRLAQRDEGEYSDYWIEYSFKVIKRSLHQLRLYFKNDNSIQKEDAIIYSEWLEGQITNTINMARNIDDAYNNSFK